VRWRFHRQFPKELDDAEKPLVDLVRGEVSAAIDEGYSIHLILMGFVPHRSREKAAVPLLV
jgi:hypothetical protein